MKEVMMTRRVRLWITAVLSIAAMALVVGLTIATQDGVNQTHTNPHAAEPERYPAMYALILPYIEQDNLLR
jgi:hypothetical protein